MRAHKGSETNMTIRCFLRDTRGGATALAAAAVTVMTVGAGALITDHLWLVDQRDTLKTATDAAAVAATLEMNHLMDTQPGISDTALEDRADSGGATLRRAQSPTSVARPTHSGPKHACRRGHTSPRPAHGRRIGAGGLGWNASFAAHAAAGEGHGAAGDARGGWSREHHKRHRSRARARYQRVDDELPRGQRHTMRDR